MPTKSASIFARRGEVVRSVNFRRLSEPTLRALERALALVAPRAAEGAEAFGPKSESSRQARHARLSRTTALAVAACALGATEHDDLTEAFLAPDFGTLRPLSAQVHSKLAYLATRRKPSFEGLERSFARGRERLFAIAPELEGLSRNDVLSLQSALMLMLIGPIVYRGAFEAHWRSTWSQAQRAGILDNEHVRMQLAVMGTYVGRCGPHVEWLLESRSRRREMADVYCFVRRDDGDDLLELSANHVRGLELDPLDALYPPKPLSTVRLLLRYVRTCLRDPTHFTNEGQALMLLYWIADVAKHIGDLRRVATREELGKVTDELGATERVMTIEKARFWRIHDRLENGIVRRVLLDLWKTSFGASKAG
jgi:hypothetical protein